VDNLIEHCVENDGRPGLVILSIGSASIQNQTLFSDVKQLIRSFDDIPVVILSDCDDMRNIVELFHLGVKGFIPKTLEPSVVAEAIRLVQAGGTFYPAEAMIDALEAPKRVNGSDELSVSESEALATLTPRQLEVFNHLRQGKTNKTIAYDLEMQECTVKVHVRQIMKKLNAKNRTQAALFATHMQ
jgi:DNA-binding NarL/FixJ family response regulator